MHIPVVASPFTNGNFNRTPDPTKLFINMKGKTNVAVTKFSAAFSVLAGEANISCDSYKIIGDQLDSRFEVHFTDDSATAARKCATFLASLSLGRGSYKAQQVENDAGEMVQFFCNPDKNRAQVRREILCRNLREILAEPVAAIGKSVYIRKSTSSIMIDRRCLVTVFLIDEHEARLDWYQPLLLSMPSIDKEAVESSFRAIAGGQSSP